MKNLKSTKVNALYFNLDTKANERVFALEDGTFVSDSKVWSNDIELRDDTFVILMSDIIERYAGNDFIN